MELESARAGPTCATLLEELCESTWETSTWETTLEERPTGTALAAHGVVRVVAIVIALAKLWKAGQIVTRRWTVSTYLDR